MLSQRPHFLDPQAVRMSSCRVSSLHSTFCHYASDLFGAWFCAPFLSNGIFDSGSAGLSTKYSHLRQFVRAEKAAGAKRRSLSVHGPNRHNDPRRLGAPLQRLALSLPLAFLLSQGFPILRALAVV